MRADADVQRILGERARKLAGPGGVKAEQRAEAGLKLLEFRLAQESYGLEERHVQEVQVLRSLTPLPCTPRFLRGVVNLRGKILPVMDLRIYLGLPEKGLADLHQVMFIEGNGLEFGLLADVVTGIRNVPFSEIGPVPPALAEPAGGRLKGMTNGRLLILDMDRILADPGIILHEEMES